MFIVKMLGFLSLLFFVHCNQGRPELEECGCQDSNRRQYLVRASMDRELIGDFIRGIVDADRGGGFGDYNPVDVDGVCADVDNRSVFFCAEDPRDYRALEERFPDVRFSSTLIE